MLFISDDKEVVIGTLDELCEYIIDNFTSAYRFRDFDISVEFGLPEGHLPSTGIDYHFFEENAFEIYGIKKMDRFECVDTIDLVGDYYGVGGALSCVSLRDIDRKDRDKYIADLKAFITDMVAKNRPGKKIDSVMAVML